MAEVVPSSTIANNSGSPRPMSEMTNLSTWQKIASEAAPNSNLIINYLPPTYTDEQLYTLFVPYGHILHHKIVKNLDTSRSMGYGFVQFADATSATNAIQNLNGYPVMDKNLKVSIARPASAEIKRSNLYIIGLPPTWGKKDLVELFSPYGEVVESRILLDTNQQSRGVGFCRLGSNAAALRAIDALNGTMPNGGNTKLTIKIADNPNHVRRNHGMYGNHLHGQGHLHGQHGQHMGIQGQGQGHNSMITPYGINLRYPYNQSAYPYNQQIGHNQHFPNNQHQHQHFNNGTKNNMNPNMNTNMNNMNNMNVMNNMNNIPGNTIGMASMNNMGMNVSPNSPVMQGMHAGALNSQIASPNNGSQFPTYCLFVYHLPLDVTDQALYELFANYAQVTSTKVMKDVTTGRSKGYGFVNVLTEEDGYRAIQHLNTHKMGNKFIKVAFKSNKSNGPGKIIM